MKNHVRELATRIAVGGALLLCAMAAQAQWAEQRIPLRPGWNAIFLEVQPDPDRCDQLFAGQPIESVWKWNKQLRTTQFETDPSVLMPGDPHWLVWMSAGHPQAFLSTLHGMQAQHAYLIQVSTNAAPFTWAVIGKVQPPLIEWYPYTLNLIGMPVNPAHPPTFADFFAHTAEVDAAPDGAGQIYAIGTSGAGIHIRQTANYNLAPGVAYWIQAKNPVDYAGPLQVVSGTIMDFGQVLVEKVLVIKNVSATKAVTAVLRPELSAAPPAGQPELAGPVALSWYDAGATGETQWVELADEGIRRTLQAGAEWSIRFAVRRGDLEPFSPSGTNGAAYQSLLKLTDSADSLLVRIPVLADNPSTGVLRKRVTEAQRLAPDAHPCQGLWVGEAAVGQVSSPYFTGTNVFASPAPMNLRIILHVNESGAAYLLQSVIMALAPLAGHSNLVYQLFTSDQTLPSGASDIYRVSSVGFPIMNPLPVGTWPAIDSGTLTGRVFVGCNDPLNPFLHRFNPMHDNKDGNWVTYTNGVETVDITRDFSLVFQASTNAQMRAMWGMDVASGVFSETITGPRKDPVVVQGTFGLRRVSREGVLTGL